MLSGAPTSTRRVRALEQAKESNRAGHVLMGPMAADDGSNIVPPKIPSDTWSSRSC